MGKKMDKKNVIYPLKDKKVMLGDFVWMHAEKAILEQIGTEQKDEIKKPDLIKAIEVARNNKDLKDAYVKFGVLDGTDHLYMRIKAKRLLKDHEEDVIAVKEYNEKVQKHLQGQQALKNFVIEENKREKEVDTSSVTKNLAALEKHTLNREETTKGAVKFLKLYQPYLERMRDLRKGGQATLTQARNLATKSDEVQLEFSETFMSNRGALNPKISKALDQAPELKDTVASWRKRSATAFDQGMRVMAEIRGIKETIRAELQQHEFEAEQNNTDHLRSDALRLKQLEVLRPEVELIVKHSTITKIQSWRKMVEFTDEGIPIQRENPEDDRYYFYTTKRDEAMEGFRSAESFVTQLSTLRKRVARLLTGNNPPVGTEATQKIRQVFDPTTKLSEFVKRIAEERQAFELAVIECDRRWQELLDQ